MKKKYLVVFLLMMLIGISFPKALMADDCKVLVSFKSSSSLDKEVYICKGIDYGTSSDSIYYSSQDDTIYLNNFSAYYFTTWNEYDVKINISNQNNISLLRLSDSKFKVTGNGTLKFKQNSFVKKVTNGEPIYQYVYKDKILLDQNKKIYEGTILEFEENYENLRGSNDIPLEYNLTDFVTISAIDYTKMTPIIVTENWIDKHIETDLGKKVLDGYGILEYVEVSTDSKKEEKEPEKKQLESDNVILIAEENFQTKYKLKETDLKDQEVAIKVSEKIDQDLISLYDVSVYNGKNEVSMKNGKYILKIKIDQVLDSYENYKIIYVNEKNEIAEYINGQIEGEYIVFETTHLSQYGVIATPKNNISPEINSSGMKKNRLNIACMLKISVLVLLATISSILIIFILIKSNLLAKNKKKRKRA